MFKVNNISEVRDVDALYCIKTATDTEFSIVVTDAFGAIVNLKDLQTPAGIQGIASDDGTIEVTGATFKNLRLSATLVNAINSSLKTGDNISELVNDAGYLTSFTETDPIFQASEASLFVSGDKANLDNQSGINTGDETTSSIQTKRPLKTVDNKSLEGTGNIEIDYNTVINKPTSFPPSAHTHIISEVVNLQNELNSKENISNKVNTISGNSSTEYPTEKAVVDYVSSQIGADFAKVVYFDNVTPNVASIFDLNNPPLVNDPSLKEDVANLYIGTDASTWVYITSPAGYVTKTVTSSGSNFYITGTNTDAGSIKTGSITKKGQIVIDSEVVNDSGLTLKKTESSILKTDSLGKVVKATNLQDVEYAPIVHTHTVSQITDFPTFKTIEGQSVIGAGNIDLDKNSVGLGNVDNTSDLNKIISTATQTALNAKANISGQVFTGAVSATNLSGTNTGDNAPNSLYSGLVTNATHTGEVTGSTALTITNGAVTNAKLANVATSTLKGRVAATTGVVEDLTASQVRTLLNVADGANNYVHPANHLASIITQDASNRFVTDTEKSAWNAKEPAIASGTISQYWRGDKTWQPFPAQATVDQSIIDGSTNAVSGNAVFDGLALKANLSGGNSFTGNQTITGNVTATTLIKSGGTSSQFLKADGSIDSNSYALASSTHNPVTIGTANGLSLSTQVLSLGLASSDVTGALSGTDWNTFNGKFNTPSGLAINYLPKWNGSGFGNSSISDDSANIKLLLPTEIGYEKDIYFGNRTGLNYGIGVYFNQNAQRLIFYNGLGGFNLLQLNRVNSNVEIAPEIGKLLVGTTTDNGVDKVQVNGSGYFSGGLRIPSGQLFLTGSEGDANFMRIVSTPTSSYIQYAAGTTGGSRGRLAFTGLYGGNETMVLNGDGSVTVNGNITASPAVSPNQVVVKSQLDAVAGRPYKVYTALLSQSGTNAPTATVLENTLGGTVTYTYISIGIYEANLAGVFTTLKTTATLSLGQINGTSSGRWGAYSNSTSTIRITTLENGLAADGRLLSATLEIRVYP